MSREKNKLIGIDLGIEFARRQQDIPAEVGIIRLVERDAKYSTHNMCNMSKFQLPQAHLSIREMDSVFHLIICFLVYFG